MNSSRIKDLIVPGSLISLCVGNELTSSLNIIYRCIDDEIDIPLTEDLMKQCFFINSCVKLKYKTDDYEYIIYGSICRIDLSELPFIRVKVTECAGNINNRKFPRLDVRLPAGISASDNKIYFCLISNISLGGVSFLINKDLSDQNECEINIYLNNNSSIYARGIITEYSCRDSLYEYRMQFTYMNEENSNSLYSCIYLIDKAFDPLRNKYLG